MVNRAVKILTMPLGSINLKGSVMTLEQLFIEAKQAGASDLHLVAGKSPIIRINGELKPLGHPEMTPKKIEELVLSLLTIEQKEKFLSKKDLDISHQLKDSTRFRVNLHFEKNNMGLVARVIPSEIPTMEDIEMPSVVFDVTRLDYGLILVTGPTGCGKSTSLAAMIDLINHERTANIITLEDPIEFIFKSDNSIVKQRQLGTDIVSFAEGLKHALRQDPNVIMVGEMRDLDTIATTLTLAETGHLVLATLHTPNSTQTIDRIIDVFPPHQQTQVRLQLSYSLKAVISQRLLPETSNNKRVAAREILINNPAVANLIRENKLSQIKSVIQTSAEEGMVSMDKSIKKLLQEDRISKEVAIAHISSPEVLN
ncbi:MAG: type IV pilus twitching motility protein PilT [Patescibacteria group bacterium]